MEEIKLTKMENDGISVLSPANMIKEYESKGYKVVEEKEEKKKAGK